MRSEMITRQLSSHRAATVTCALTALTALMSAALLAAAVFVPAPPFMLAFVTAVCILFPMLSAWQASPAIAVLKDRGARLDERALFELRRDLQQLPETRHPLDL
jgi:hypothetical protein